MALSQKDKMFFGSDKKDKVYNILFCGIGGQGVLKAAEVCATAAMLDGYHVKKSEVHGMAQRGGSVESHLRFGKEVFSPLIPKGEADFLVPFYKDEALRLESFLKVNGLNLLETLKDAQKEFLNKRFINTYILGVLSKSLPITKESWIKAIEYEFESKNLTENKDIFLMGRGE